MSYHLLINPGTPDERNIHLDKPAYRLGRSQAADIIVADQNVSGIHLSFLLSEDRAEIIDLNSTNGTVVNGRKISKAVLGNGDIVSIAGVKMIFRIETDYNFSRTAVYTLPGQRTGDLSYDLSSILEGKLGRSEAEKIISELSFHSRNSRLLEVLCDILQKILPGSDRDEIIVMLLKEIRKLIDLETTGIYICDERRFCVLDGEMLCSGENNKIVSQSVLQKVLKSKAPVILDNAGSGEDISGFASLVKFNIKSLLCFPVLNRSSEVIAVVYCVSKKADRLKLLGNDKSFLMACSSFVSLALENVRLIENEKAESYRRASIQGEKMFTPVINRLKQTNENLSLKLGGSFPGVVFFGLEDKCNSNIKEFIQKSARTGLPVLITGETGAGKSLLAREIHNRSGLCGPFITIDCTTIPSELLESELFGHERGAFTGAHARKPGKVSSACGGTLFIDEIGELSGSLQSKLLRFIQSGEYEPLGGSGVVRSDARVITATNRDLKLETAQKRFREDLYFRLNVLHFEIPPVRKRPELIPVMAAYFLDVYGPKLNAAVKGFTHEASKLMKDYSWPGNIREIENAVMRALVNAGSDLIDAPDMGIEASVCKTDLINPVDNESLDLKKARERIDKILIAKALESTGNNVSGAAKLLNISRNALMDLMKKYQL